MGAARRPVARHDIEGLRRSLAMGGGLPAEQIRDVLDACDTLLAEHADTVARDEHLRVELDALRPVVAELRTRLGALHQALHPPA